MMTQASSPSSPMLAAIMVLGLAVLPMATRTSAGDVEGMAMDMDVDAEARLLNGLNGLTLAGIVGGRGFREAAWERPGCHKVGHTRKVSIPDCVEFTLSTNACRGYCESWSIPSSLETVAQNPHQPVTSVGQCCSMMDTEEIEVNVMCIDGVRNLKFKSALSCSCYHCKKE